MKKIFLLAAITALLIGKMVGQTAYITNQNSNTVSVVNVATNTLITTIPVGINPIGVSVSSDGNRVYITNDGSNTVSVIATSTNTVLATIPVGNRPRGIAVNPDGSKVYVINYVDYSISVINTSTNTVSATIINAGHFPWGVSFSPDGTKAYVTNSGNNSLIVMNAVTNTVTNLIPVGYTPMGLVVSPDGTKVYVGNGGDNTVSVISTLTNSVLATITGLSAPYGLTISPDGSKVYVSCWNTSSVNVINTISNTVSTIIPVLGDPWGISIHPDGSKVYVANVYNNLITVISTAADTVINTIGVGAYPTAFGNFISPHINCFSPQPPTITPSGPTTFCQGNSVALTCSAATAYAWSTGSTTQGITVNASGNYGVTISDANGCTATASQLVTVYNSPSAIISINGNATVCAGDSVSLSCSAGASYHWSNGSSNDTAFAATAGLYSVTLTDLNGCTAVAAPVNVIVTARPTAAFSTTLQTGCSPFHETFSNSSTHATAYWWDFGDSLSSINTNPNHTYLHGGTYTVTLVAYNDTSICPNDTLVMTNYITVHAAPSPVVSGPTSICGGDSALLTTDSMQAYHWTTGATTQSIYADTTGTYYVTVTDNNGCTGVSSGNNLFVYPLPVPTITPSGSTSLCIGDSVTLTSSSADSYLWNTGNTTQSITTDTSGIYTVVITVNTGCTGASLPMTVAVHALPTPIITTNDTLCYGDSITCTAGASYLWNTGDTTRSIMADTSGIYFVLMTDANGCSAYTPADTVTVYQVFISPVITQHGDTLISNNVYNNQWLFNNVPITNDTNQTHVVTANGCYSVMITGSYGCTAVSAPICITNVGIHEIGNGEAFSIYPIPNHGSFTLNIPNQNVNEIHFKITDVIGRIINEQSINNPQQTIPISINETQGIYFIEMRIGNNAYYRKIVID
ncbi:MAG: beta-propeller fold lactonase family protein [Bacteroidota bacterium]